MFNNRIGYHFLLLCLFSSVDAYTQFETRVALVENPSLEQVLPFIGTQDVYQSKQITYEKLIEDHRVKGEYEKAFYYAIKLNNIKDSLIVEMAQAKPHLSKANKDEEPQGSVTTLSFDSEAISASLSQQKINTNFMFSSYFLVLLALCLGYFLMKNRKEKDRQISDMSVVIEKKNQLLKDRKQQIEILNEELSHRVKNNLMFVSSLMRMQARRLENSEAKAAIKEAENRVEAMAMVHRRLYEQDKIMTIEMNDYLYQLGDYLLKSYAAIDSTPVIKLSFEQLTLESDTAIQIGLIVNELMTNSFKHAFEKQRHPTIIIDMIKNQDHIQLIYSDNGVGVPFDFNLEKSGSLGLRLIHDLTEQLNGTVEISNQDGAHFQFDFEDIRITG